VENGETLFALARRMSGPVEGRVALLRVLNHLPEDATLRIGQKIKIFSD
jgi:predicted Zn-dependent protease